MKPQVLVQRPVYTNDDFFDPVIETDVVLDSGKNYVLSVAKNPKVADITWFLLPALRKHYGGYVEQIAIVPFRPSERHDKQYVLVNEELKRLLTNGEIAEYGLLNVPAAEMNRQVSSSEFVKELIGRILEQQDHLFVNLYKNSTYFDLHEFDGRVTFLAPGAEYVEYFDNKITQRREVVEDLDIPVPRSFIAQSIDELAGLYRDNFDGKAFVMRSHSSSGSGTEVVDSEEAILSSLKIVQDEEYIISDFLDVEISPSTLGVVAGDGVYVAGLSDQILVEGVQYFGNVSPSAAGAGQREEMVSLTEKIGDYLGVRGYRGPFGVDFIIDKRGELYFTELNPRLIGATAELTRAHMQVNPDAPSIPEMIFNAVVYDTLGFDTGSCELPQISWGYKIVKGDKGDRTKTIEGRERGHADILGYPGDDLNIYSYATVARVVCRNSPGVTKEEILDILDRRAGDIKLY
ncbi:MAG: ATP-grasp domain-containing protein [archaeon]|nr:ATP-grasp domain-containing protein [archaeon]